MSNDLEKLAKIIKQKNKIGSEVSAIINRPALIGHTGEYIASEIFDIELEDSASCKAIDGKFRTGRIAGKTVNIKWYGKLEGILDVTQDEGPDFYLVFTGLKAPAASSRGHMRPWVISSVFLFDAHKLLGGLQKRGLKHIGIATSVAKKFWESALIWSAAEPNLTQNNDYLTLSETQKKELSLFG